MPWGEEGNLALRGRGVGAAWTSTTGLRMLSVAVFLSVWALLSAALSHEVLPTPGQTFEALVDEYQKGRLLFHLGMTTRRVVLSFLLAMGVGVAAGLGMGATRVVDKLLEPWLVIGLAVPRIVIIVIAYLMVGLNDTAAVLAIALVVAPPVVAQVREGARAIDRRLVDMARVFRRSRHATLTRVVIPQLLPYIVGTARGAMSLTWKMVMFAELMGRTNGVGYQINFYFQMFTMKGILAYTLLMVALIAILDLGFLAAVERYAFRWRRFSP